MARHHTRSSCLDRAGRSTERIRRRVRGERPAATRAHGLLDWLEPSEARGADRNTARREERGAADSAGRREENCGERINRGAQDHKKITKSWPSGTGLRTLLQAARGNKVSYPYAYEGTRRYTSSRLANKRGIAGVQPAGPHGLSFGVLGPEMGSLNFSHAARQGRHTTLRRLNRREMRRRAVSCL